MMTSSIWQGVLIVDGVTHDIEIYKIKLRCHASGLSDYSSAEGSVRSQE